MSDKLAQDNPVLPAAGRAAGSGLGWASAPLVRKDTDFAFRAEPDYIHSDNGLEFTCRVVKTWPENTGVNTLFIAPGSP